MNATRAEICAVACAEIFRDSGEILGSAFGAIPGIGVRLARHTFAPDLMLSDGETLLVMGTWAVDEDPDGPVEGWLPYRNIFDLVWSGRRHVVMTPAQIDRYGNANISAIGEYRAPKVQLIGMRGAPGNTVNHPTSYWIPRHDPRVFVPEVDVSSGAGHDRVRAAGAAASAFHDLRRVVTDLAVLDFEPQAGAMRLLSTHPGVDVDTVLAATGFDLIVGDGVGTTRTPTEEELILIRTVIDPRNKRDQEVAP